MDGTERNVGGGIFAIPIPSSTSAPSVSCSSVWWPRFSRDCGMPGQGRKFACSASVTRKITAVFSRLLFGGVARIGKSADHVFTPCSGSVRLAGVFRRYRDSKGSWRECGLLEFLFLAIRNFVCVGPLLSLYIFDDSYDLILDRESTRGRNLGKRKVEVVKDNACERGICLGNFLGRCLEFYVARIHENQDVRLRFPL